MSESENLAGLVNSNPTLKACLYSYLNLLSNLDNVSRFNNQKVLIELRDAIAERLGFSSQNVQEYAEEAALRMRVHFWTYQSALSSFYDSLLK